MEPNVWMIALAATGTAVATGLGALPLLFKRGIVANWTANGQASAAGLMMAATTLLVAEGSDRGVLRVMAGMIAGFVLINLANRYLPEEDNAVTMLGAQAGRSALLFVLLMTAHSFAEGMGIGVAFGGGNEFGFLVTVAIALHNIPEGLAVSLVLVAQGASLLRAAAWSVATSLPQILLAVPSFVFVQAFEPVLPVGLGAAAGAMAWMVVFSMLPEAYETASRNSVATWFAGSMAFMVGVQGLLG